MAPGDIIFTAEKQQERPPLRAPGDPGLVLGLRRTGTEECGPGPGNVSLGQRGFRSFLQYFKNLSALRKVNLNQLHS